MTQTNPKELVINLLKDNISVLDDSAQAINGIVAGTWYDTRVLGTNKWMVTVGPIIGGNLAPNDIGANNWLVKNILVVNIWVPILESSDYTPEKLRYSIKEELKRLLKLELVDPATDIRFLHLMNWREIDDRENDILRTELSIDLEWNETP